MATNETSMDSLAQSFQKLTLDPNVWKDTFPGTQQIGTDYMFDWSKDLIKRSSDEEIQTGEYLKGILRQHGYILNWEDAIAIGHGREFDHSVWRVERPYSAQTSEDNNLVTFGDVMKYGINLDKQFGIPAGRYACKIVSLHYYLHDPRNNSHDMDWAIWRLLREAQTLLAISHRNIVNCVDYVLLPDRQTSFPYPHIAVIMELLHGTLEQVIQDCQNSTQKGMPLISCMGWFVQVARGLRYLHYELGTGVDNIPQYMIHNALQARNVLYKILPNDRYVYKLGDFEECRSLGPNEVANEPHYHSRDVKDFAFCLLFALIGNTFDLPGIQRYFRNDTADWDDEFYLLIHDILYSPYADVPNVTMILENQFVQDNTPEWLN